MNVLTAICGVLQLSDQTRLDPSRDLGLLAAVVAQKDLQDIHESTLLDFFAEIHSCRGVR